MLKMILDPMGGILLTNDGNAILREIEVGHPAAKSMIELSRTQDEEVGDGTTSVIILGESFVGGCESKTLMFILPFHHQLVKFWHTHCLYSSETSTLSS
jgi:chaperonin GroEL (HSP60 family)